MGPPLWQKAHLVQPCSNACPCICVCLHPPSLVPPLHPTARTLIPGMSLLLLNLQPNLCPQPSALPPPGCSSNKSWSCRKDLHNPPGTNTLCTPEEERGPGVSSVGARALCALCSSLSLWDPCWVIRVADCNPPAAPAQSVLA